MRFRFESRTADGLRVLPELPDISPCLIEGRNGIGKTVAVRLLELIAGKQPFEGAGQQWHSLRRRLGRTVVRIDSLRDEQELEFAFTPEAWLADVDPPLELGSWLGEAKINGKAATVAEAQSLIWVERFAGNEDLDHTLRRRTQIYADHASRTSRAVTAAVGRIAAMLEPLREELESVDPGDLAAMMGELDAAVNEEDAARSKLAELLSQHEQVLSAIDARDRLRAAEDPSNELQHRRGELVGRLNALSSEREVLAQRIEVTSEDLKRQGDAQATLGESQGILRYRLKRQRNIAAAIARLSGLLGMEASVERVVQEQEATREAITALRERQRAIDVGGMTGRLVDVVVGLLDGPGAQGLDEQTLALLSDRELSVSEARNGMIGRRDQLRGEPTPDELESLAREAKQLQRRLALLGDLLLQLDDLDKLQGRLEEAEVAVEKAEGAVERAGQRDEQYRSDNQRLGALEEEIDSVARQLTDLHATLGLEGGRSPEDALADLRERLNGLQLSEIDDLDGLERDVRGRLGEARAGVERAATHAAALRRGITVVSASIDAAVSAVRSDDRFAWLHDLLERTSTDSMNEFAQIRTRVLGFMDILEDTRNLVEAVGQLAGGALETHPMVLDVELNEAVRAVLAEELRQSLDSPQIREWLFGGASVESIRLADRELVLKRNGNYSSRAFDTFSTGEQAFAFTQARILELEPSPRPNRLLVLDEFGAYVAADRMPDLADFLRSPKVAPIADQVLVILPLQIDYEAELANTTGALRARYEACVAQLQERGYYTKQLDA